MKFSDLIRRNARIRLNLPFFSYELTLDDLMDSKQVDERIARLGEIKGDLESAVAAVESLRTDAAKAKVEAESLRSIEQLR